MNLSSSEIAKDYLRHEEAKPSLPLLDQSCHLGFSTHNDGFSVRERCHPLDVQLGGVQCRVALAEELYEAFNLDGCIDSGPKLPQMRELFRGPSQIAKISIRVFEGLRVVVGPMIQTAEPDGPPVKVRARAPDWETQIFFHEFVLYKAFRL